MDKLLSDPSVMEQCAKLLSNPTIMKQMSELLSDPAKMASLTDTLLRPKHPTGTTVRLEGLATLDLNGRTGVVQAYDASTTRYTVLLDEPGGKPISVKEGHCARVDDDDAHATA